MWMKLGLAAAMALTLSGCGRPAGDRYGVYADGDFYIVANHADQRINFTNESHPTPAQLLDGSRHGDGISFKTWRDPASCGLTDDKGNVFLIQRNGKSLRRALMTYDVVADDPVYAKVNGGENPSVTVRVTAAGRVRMVYSYDDAVGIRYIDRYAPDGTFDRRIVLEKGTGLLEHCRGFSLKDQKWYSDLNKDAKS